MEKNISASHFLAWVNSEAHEDMIQTGRKGYLQALRNAAFDLFDCHLMEGDDGVFILEPVDVDIAA